MEYIPTLSRDIKRLVIEWFFHKDYCFCKGLQSTIPGDTSLNGRLDFLGHHERLDPMGIDILSQSGIPAKVYESSAHEGPFWEGRLNDVVGRGFKDFCWFTGDDPIWPAFFVGWVAQPT